MDISRQQHYRSLYEEHIAELGFNLSDRQTIFHTESLSWQDCAELEQYIAAHLSALRLGGAEAYQVLREQLESIDEDELLGALFALVSIDTLSDGIEVVIEAFQEADEDTLPLFVEALKYGLNPTLTQDLLPLLESESALIRAATIEIVGYRGDLDPKRLWPLLHDSDALVQSAVMVALMRLGYRQALPFLEALLLEQADVSDEMLLLLLVLGSTQVKTVIRQTCQDPNRVSDQRLILIALFGDTQDFALLVNALHYPELKPIVYESMGILGDIQSIPLLIVGLKSDVDAERIAAATALNYLTGANLYQNVTLLEIEEPDLEVVDITGEPVNNASRPSSEPAQRTVEVELPCLDPVVWQNWWQAHQGRFDTTQRWRHGYPITQSRLVNELNQPQVVYQKRQLVYFELLIRFQINISFEADWFMTKQVSALEAMQSPIMVTN